MKTTEKNKLINFFNSQKDYQNYLRKEGKPFDSVIIGEEEFMQESYDISGSIISYRGEKGSQLEIKNENRYKKGFFDSRVYIYEGMYF